MVVIHFCVNISYIGNERKYYMKNNKYMILPIMLLFASTTLYSSNNVHASSNYDIKSKVNSTKDYVKSIAKYQSIKNKPNIKVIKFTVGESNKSLHPEDYAEPKEAPKESPQQVSQVASSQQPTASVATSASTSQPQVQNVTQPSASQQQESKQSSAYTANAQATSGSTVKVTFYDPAVLGASTMPGGIYSGVAANLSVYPKGTVLRITLQDGQVMTRTVNDTGAFASSNPNQLDIAIPNSQVPSWGTGTAQVQVIG